MKEEKNRENCWGKVIVSYKRYGWQKYHNTKICWKNLFKKWF